MLVVPEIGVAVTMLVKHMLQYNFEHALPCLLRNLVGSFI